MSAESPTVVSVQLPDMGLVQIECSRLRSDLDSLRAEFAAFRAAVAAAPLVASGEGAKALAAHVIQQAVHDYRWGKPNHRASAKDFLFNPRYDWKASRALWFGLVGMSPDASYIRGLIDTAQSPEPQEEDE